MKGTPGSDTARLAMPRALLLDLDGTLIDSAPDIAAALDRVLAARNLGPIPVAQVRRLIGHGIGRLVSDAFVRSGAPLAGDALESAQQEMAAHYAAQLVARTALMPGAADLVAFCAQAGIAMACVTNKPRRMAQDILRHFRVAPPISVIVGGDMGMARKPSPQPLLAALAQIGVPNEAAWMVGDGLPDHRAARAAQIVSVAVASGYGEPYDAAGEATIAVDSLDQVVELLRDLRQPAGRR
mgnify:CR=1 FL=1